MDEANLEQRTTHSSEIEQRAQRRRVAFETLEREVENQSLEVEGTIPSWLEGTLLRTGPAAFEAGDQDLNHWFDGLAMLHSFSIGDSEVKYTNSYLESKNYSSVAADSELAYPEFATDPCRDIFERIFSMFSPEFSDNANVNISRQADSFVSMTETPLPVEFDPETLETVGVAEYDDGLDSHTTTAHPHHEDGVTYNYVTEFSRTSTYKIYRMPDGTREREVIATIERDRPAYMHSFGLTESCVVLAEFPFVLNPVEMLLRDRPFVENYRWNPDRGTRFLLVDRETGELVANPVAEPFFAFHHVNAFEDGDAVVVDVAAYDDASIIDSFYLEELRSPEFSIDGATLRRYRIGEQGVSSEQLFEDPIELPRINYEAANMQPYRYVYGVGNEATSPSDIPTRLVKFDLEDDSTAIWSELATYPGEPVFVGAPDAATEDEGVILSVVLDPEPKQSTLLVLDAAEFDELARATVDHHIPAGFHGGFYDV